MDIKITNLSVGLAKASTERWKHATQCCNRLHIPVDGKAVYHDIKADCELCPGNAYLMFNSSASDLEMLPGIRYFHIYLDFQTMPPLLNHEILTIDLEKDSIFMHLFETIHELLLEAPQVNLHYSPLKDRNPEIYQQCRELLKVIIMRLHHVYKIDVVENPNVERAIGFINEHFAEPLQNKTIASELHIDARYLIRLFTKHIGISPYQYLTQCRVEHGIEYLRSGKNVGETAYLCGYQSENAFRIAFKRIMGYPPRTILKQKL